MKIFMLTLALILPVPAIAQERVCGLRDKILNDLSEQYGESKLFDGVTTSNVPIELWVNMNTGSWTIVVGNNIDDNVCLADAGNRAWGILPEPKGDDV